MRAEKSFLGIFWTSCVLLPYYYSFVFFIIFRLDIALVWGMELNGRLWTAVLEACSLVRHGCSAAIDVSFRWLWFLMALCFGVVLDGLDGVCVATDVSKFPCRCCESLGGFLAGAAASCVGYSLVTWCTRDEVFIALVLLDGVMV